MNEGDRIDEAAIARAARGVFERSVAGLDAETRFRLARARHEALRQHAEPRAETPLFPSRAWAAAAVAVAVALAVAWLLPDGTAPPPGRGAQLASSPDVELLLDADELDMLEDLDFYSWLGEQADPPPADADGVG